MATHLCHNSLYRDFLFLTHITFHKTKNAKESEFHPQNKSCSQREPCSKDRRGPLCDRNSLGRNEGKNENNKEIICVTSRSSIMYFDAGNKRRRATHNRHRNRNAESRGYRFHTDLRTGYPDKRRCEKDQQHFCRRERQR